jgi:hypothetical protein
MIEVRKNLCKYKSCTYPPKKRKKVDSLSKFQLFYLFISLETGLEKPSIRKYAHKIDHEGEDIKYEADFVVPPDFGEIGAIFVENEHHKEMYLHDVVLDGFPTGPVHVTCDSWIHSKFDNKKKRLFFTNKVSYFLIIRLVPKSLRY